jgi:hypothetical protein
LAVVVGLVQELVRLPRQSVAVAVAAVVVVLFSPEWRLRLLDRLNP